MCSVRPAHLNENTMPTNLWWWQHYPAGTETLLKVDGKIDGVEFWEIAYKNMALVNSSHYQIKSYTENTLKFVVITSNCNEFQAIGKFLQDTVCCMFLTWQLVYVCSSIFLTCFCFIRQHLTPCEAELTLSGHRRIQSTASNYWLGHIIQRTNHVFVGGLRHQYIPNQVNFVIIV